MKLLVKYLFLIVIGTLLFSCQKDNSQKELLKQAENSLFIGKPDVTLNLLASIQNPEEMDKGSYMQYIVTYVGAKKETKADITADTLIFEAQNYFKDTKDYRNSALANYYAGWVFYVNNKLPQSLGSFMCGADAADKSKNYLLAAKSFNNIGYIYFGRMFLDNAIVNYKKALEHYGKIENVDKNKIQVLTNIGLTYDSGNRLDSAYVYFQQGLDLAKQTSNKLEESQLYQNLGLVSFGRGEDEKAIEYFKSALAMDITSNEQIRQINLQLLKIYNKRQDLQSAKEYTVLVTANLPEVTYNYTIKKMYAALTDYYRQLGDYKKALEYSDLEKATKEEIEKEADGAALLAADKNFHLSQKDKEVKQFRSHIYLFLMIGGIAFCIVLVFFLFVWRDNKKGKAEIRECAERYNEIKVLLFAMGEKYPRIEAEIKSILEAD